MDRLADLKKRGDPVGVRAREASSRPEAFDTFAKSLIHTQKFLQKCRDGVSGVAYWQRCVSHKLPTE